MASNGTLEGGLQTPAPAQSATALGRETVSMVDPPRLNDPGVRAAFKDPSSARVLLTVDTEEEFDWNRPFSRDAHGLKHVEALPRFQQFCEGIGAHPVYLVDWPIANDPRAIEIIGDAVRRGAADIGVQLHPWVNPPFEEEVSTHHSFSGNLPRGLEARKFVALRDQIEQAFGVPPRIYRAGRYGLGPNTSELLKANGIAIDTSVRSLFDYSDQDGPDYSDHPVAPYWVGDDHALLELPVTTVYWGLLRQMGKSIHRIQRFFPTLFAGFSKFKLLERIALTPEGVTAEEALRGIDIALDERLPVLVLSLHSPSLAPGYTPYSQSDEDVEALYEWLRQIYGYLSLRGVNSANVAQLIDAVER